MNFKILVVDDNFDLRENLSSWLEKRRYQVVQASNAIQALEILKECLEIDIVLTDLQMGSEDDGVVLLNQSRCANVNIPFILMSLSVRGNEEIYLKLGFHAVIDKLRKDFEEQIIENIKQL